MSGKKYIHLSEKKKNVHLTFITSPFDNNEVELWIGYTSMGKNSKIHFLSEMIFTCYKKISALSKENVIRSVAKRKET